MLILSFEEWIKFVSSTNSFHINSTKETDIEFLRRKIILPLNWYIRIQTLNNIQCEPAKKFEAIVYPRVLTQQTSTALDGRVYGYYGYN